MPHTLIDYVNDVPLYRRHDEGYILRRRPTVLYCEPGEVTRGLEHFRALTGRDPEWACLHGPDGDRAADRVSGCPVMALSSLRHRPDLLVYLYGERERGKGVTLALAGVRHLCFATDPPYREGRYDPAFLKAHADPLEEVFALLADEESRRTFASVVRHRITGEHGYLRIAAYPEYHHPHASARPGDHVVDGGVFDGATSVDFARSAIGGHVYAFEPDPDNLRRIHRLLEDTAPAHAAMRAGRVEVVEAALFDRPCTLRFSSGRGGSSSMNTLSSGEVIDVAAIDLDGFFRQQGGGRCDLISLDVEGAEREALAGAEETIARHRPTLQVSIYHKQADLFELPLSIHRRHRDYVLFVGHHNTYSTETDLYAVPKERL